MLMHKTSLGYRALFEAYLGNYLTFSGYLNSYHEAFKALMKEVETSGWHVDRFAYPLLFMARHCLELGFKTNIRHFSKYSRKSDHTKSTSHNLIALFGAFRLHIGETIKKLKDDHSEEVDPSEVTEFETYCSELEKLTDVFNKLDEGSDSFRYPVNSARKVPSFQFDDRINLLDVEKLLSQAMILFNHTADVFSKYTDYMDEIEKMYEDELRSASGR
jgi:hypothetical protein